MSQLAKVQLAAAPACPNCRNQVTDLDLNRLAEGGEHQCLFCSHVMRVPKQIIQRLIAQQESLQDCRQLDSPWVRLKAFFVRLFS
jgi:hydrogenase maturation factor